MSWLPLKVTKEELARQEAELRANWGNVPLVDESTTAIPEAIQKRIKNTDKLLKEDKRQ